MFLDMLPNYSWHNVLRITTEDYSVLIFGRSLQTVDVENNILFSLWNTEHLHDIVM